MQDKELRGTYLQKLRMAILKLTQLLVPVPEQVQLSAYGGHGGGVFVFL